MEKNSQKKILVVDDVLLVRTFLGDVLDRYDISAEYATNGQEAVNVWAEGDFNAIVMDLDMPIMGGLEATRIIRKREKEEKRKRTPIIAVSGTEMSDASQNCLQAGMDSFLAKPMIIRDIIDVILPLVE